MLIPMSGCSTQKEKEFIHGNWDLYNFTLVLNIEENLPYQFTNINKIFGDLNLKFYDDSLFSRQELGGEVTWGRWEHLKDQGFLILSYNNSEREDVMLVERLTENELTLASHDISF